MGEKTVGASATWISAYLIKAFDGNFKTTALLPSSGQLPAKLVPSILLGSMFMCSNLPRILGPLRRLATAAISVLHLEAPNEGSVGLVLR